jgi:hypothetical protein
MASNEKLDSLFEVTPKFLGELSSWLDSQKSGSFKGGGTGVGIPGVEWEDVGTFNSGVTIPLGSSFTFFDHLGNPVFRINEDGSLHGKTGKTLVFDL